MAAGSTDAAQIAAALEEQGTTGERIGEILVRRGAAPEEVVARALSRQLRLGYASPPLQPDEGAFSLVDRSLARRHEVVPLAVRGGSLRVAMADPLDAAAIDDLRFQTGLTIEPLVSPAHEIRRILREAYPPAAGRSGQREAFAAPAIRAQGGGARLPRDPRDPGDAPPARHDPAPGETTAIGLVDSLVGRAIAAGASDLHIEPGETAIAIRVRVDGDLRPLGTFPVDLGPAVVSRVKVLAGLDISVKRRPQDGRCVWGHGRRPGAVSLRVSTLPTVTGEKVVLRLLPPAGSGPGIERLGLAPPDRTRIGELLEMSHGAILVTGPTGSGKTTTLYALLAEVDRERRNLVTLEDPVEYGLPGITQVQVDVRGGVSFAAGLRAVLRQDPDIVMVGELRDHETVDVALAAALTGHLVLATLHTNDAASAPLRLIEMGAAPYLVAGALVGVIAQRLVPRLCTGCSVELDPPMEAAALWPAGAGRPRAGAGCARCGGRGVRGRVGIFEVLKVDDAVREAILARAGTERVRSAARAGGMTTLGRDARGKVIRGEISLEAALPLLRSATTEAPVCGRCGTDVEVDFDHCPACGESRRRRCRCGGALDRAWRCCPACGRWAAEQVSD